MRMPTILKILLGNKKAACGLFIVVSFVLMALFAPLLASYEPTKRVSRPHQPPSAEYVMGTTRMGHDIWAQFTNGARISLMVGFGAGILVCALAITVGITAGYFGGVIDECLTFLMNVVLVIPNLPLLLVLASFIGEASPTVIALIIGFTSWAYGARHPGPDPGAAGERVRHRRRGAGRAGLAHHLGGDIAQPHLHHRRELHRLHHLRHRHRGDPGVPRPGRPTVVSWGIMLYNAQTSSAILVGAWWEILAPASPSQRSVPAWPCSTSPSMKSPTRSCAPTRLNRWKKLAAPVTTPVPAVQEKTA